MLEERTMSVFTRMNSTARNRQQVRTLVDMTQIRQWHTYDPTVCYKLKWIHFVASLMWMLASSAGIPNSVVL